MNPWVYVIAVLSACLYGATYVYLSHKADHNDPHH
jgi:hypothetical protein